MPDYLVAIDLGTCNSCLCYARVGSNAVNVLDFGNMKYICPSVVYYKPDGTFDAGWKATLHYTRYDGVVNYMKRILAKRFRDIPMMVKDSLKSEVVSGPKGFAAFLVNGRIILPEDVLCDLVKFMRERFIEKCKGDGEVNVKKVVVTIPSNYVQDPIVYTKQIIKNAGFDCEIVTLPEPVAACMAYNVSEMVHSGYFMVFDIGGGTCDVALLELQGSKFIVKDHAGNDIAGALFDSLIRVWVRKHFLESLNMDIILPNDDKRKDLAEKILLDLCKEAKENLSVYESVDIDLLPYFEKLNHSNIDPSSSENDDDDDDEDCYGIKRSVMVTTSVVLTRKQLNEIINSQLTECINLIDLVLKRNDLTSNDITKIILVGGSSRLPLLETKILEIFDNSKISRSLNPDECVSRGACQFGLSTAIFTDCLHHNIYHLVGRPNDEKSYRVLLKEGTPLPCSATKTYTIRPDRPTTFFKDTLYQGPKPLESIQLAPMIVSGYTIDPDNDITVTYTIKVSEERILSFTVMDDRTKKILIQDSGPILHKHR